MTPEQRQEVLRLLQQGESPVSDMQHIDGGRQRVRRI